MMIGHRKMKTIPLTQGQVALVDNEDFEFLINYGSWYACKHNNGFYALCSKVQMVKVYVGTFENKIG